MISLDQGGGTAVSLQASTLALWLIVVPHRTLVPTKMSGLGLVK